MKYIDLLEPHHYQFTFQKIDKRKFKNFLGTLLFILSLALYISNAGNTNELPILEGQTKIFKSPTKKAELNVKYYSQNYNIDL